MPQQKNIRTDTPQRQYPGKKGSANQAEEYINEYDRTDIKLPNDKPRPVDEKRKK
jgi:hypothetical protein